MQLERWGSLASRVMAAAPDLAGALGVCVAGNPHGLCAIDTYSWEALPRHDLP
jgi:hypothetical protein